MAKSKKAYILEKIEKIEKLRDGTNHKGRKAEYQAYIDTWKGRLSKTAQKEIEKAAAKEAEELKLEQDRLLEAELTATKAFEEKQKARAEQEAKEAREREDALREVDLKKRIEELKALLPEEEREVEVIKELIEEAEEEREDEPSDSESEDATNN